MKTLVLDRRGHCVECPPCDWTHGDGDRPSHCPRHAMPAPMRLWDVELDCDHNVLVVAASARQALDIAEAFARETHREKSLPYKTAVEIPLDASRALVMYPALEVTWR